MWHAHSISQLSFNQTFSYAHHVLDREGLENFWGLKKAEFFTCQMP